MFNNQLQTFTAVNINTLSGDISTGFRAEQRYLPANALVSFNFDKCATLGCAININKSHICYAKLWWRSTVPAQIRPLHEHSHAAFEIAYFLSGNAIYTFGNKEYDIIPGSVVVFASNEQHCITEILTDDFEYIALHFDPKYLWSSSDGLSEENYNFCFMHSQAFNNLLPNANPATNEIRTLILKIEKELTN